VEIGRLIYIVVHHSSCYCVRVTRLTAYIHEKTDIEIKQEFEGTILSCVCANALPVPVPRAQAPGISLFDSAATKAKRYASANEAENNQR
jgi:hypothetical protein